MVERTRLTVTFIRTAPVLFRNETVSYDLSVRACFPPSYGEKVHPTAIDTWLREHLSNLFAKIKQLMRCRTCRALNKPTSL